MTRAKPTSRRTVAAALLLVAAATVLAAACGSDPDPSAATATTDETAPSPTGDPDATPVALPTAVGSLDIVGTEYEFAIEASGADGETLDLAAGDALSAGWTHVTFHNEGVEAHQVMFASLKEGVDLADLADTAGGDSSGSAAIEFVDMLGGVSYIGPGQSIEAMVDLPAGLVLAMCYVPDAEGVAHALMGMTASLNVVEPDGETAEGATAEGAAEPAGGGAEVVLDTIEMTADGYRFPEEMPRGWYRVVNGDEVEAGAAGTGLHELALMGLDEPLDDEALDQLLDDLATNATPDVDLVALGGMGALSAGFDGYLLCDLDPGPYLAVDFMPDPGEPRPHLLDGYATIFDV